MEDVIVRRKGESEKSIALDEVTVNLLTSAEYLESMTVEMPPESEIPREYEHEGEEVRIVLEGEIEIDVAGVAHVLKEGDVMWHKSSVPHKIKKSLRQKSCLFLSKSSPLINFRLFLFDTHILSDGR
jgi:quercetin dioxygenase-like cupin family protein